MNFDKEANWTAIENTDWKTVKERILDDKNKAKLLHLILKATGIKFTDITFRENTSYKYPVEFNTNFVRPELGVCARWIDEFQFGLYKRQPQTITTQDQVYVCLSFYPALGYTLISGGSNGFSVDNWFYYDCVMNEWIME